MTFWEFVKAKLALLAGIGIGGLYLLLVSFLCGIPGAVLLILLLSAVLVVTAGLLLAWYRTDRRLRLLKSSMDALPEKYLIGEVLEEPRGCVEREYYFLMKEISRSAIGRLEQARAEKQDYYEYVEAWVHEMKTPLTACSLLLANGGDVAKLRRELRRADNLTETILTYAKLRTVEKDTRIGKTVLRTLCNRAIREEMELLIAAGISVSVEGDGEAYTDSQLLVFILKQLLINCAKYCPGCQVQIVLSQGCLWLEDNGIGIPSCELPRVTERGFTGTAGRERGQSTGMGLYLVDRLCEKLNITMEITSGEGSGTRFTFRFPA